MTTVVEVVDVVDVVDVVEALDAEAAGFFTADTVRFGVDVVVVVGIVVGV